MTIVITLIILAIFYLQGLPLLRSRKWGELAVFLLLLSLSGFYMYGLALEFNMPNPANLIRVLTEPLAKLVFP